MRGVVTKLSRHDVFDFRQWTRVELMGIWPPLLTIKEHV